MIEFEEVLGAFSLLAELNEEAAHAASTVVELAIAELNGLLIENADTEQNRDRLSHAAAALAYYKYVLLEATRLQGGASVGDVKLNAPSDATLKIARALRDDALSAICDLTESCSFAFRQV